jgi:NitT/TauT family transport system substrate-binding protein
MDLEMTFAALLLLAILSCLLYVSILCLEKSLLTRRRIMLKPALFLLLSFVLVGCNNSPNNTATPCSLLLDWHPNPNHLPLFVGIQKGFFAEEKIDLKIQKIPVAGGGISYLTSHQVDLIVDYLPDTLRAASRGAALKIIGVLIQEPLNCIICHKDLNISHPQLLSGKKMGYCVGGSDTLFLDLLLAKEKIQLQQKIAVGGDLLAAMGSRRVDSIYGGFWNIEPLQLKMLNIETSIFKLSDFGVPKYYELIILANQNTPQSTPLFIARFQKALQKSIDFCTCNSEEAFHIYRKCHPDKRTKTLAWEKEAWEITRPLLAKDQVIEKECVENFYHFQKERSLYAQPFNYLELFPN